MVPCDFGSPELQCDSNGCDWNGLAKRGQRDATILAQILSQICPPLLPLRLTLLLHQTYYREELQIMISQHESIERLHQHLTRGRALVQ